MHPKFFFILNDKNEVMSFYEFDIVFQANEDFTLEHEFFFNYQMKHDAKTRNRAFYQCKKGEIYNIEIKSSWTVKCQYSAKSFLKIFGCLMSQKIYEKTHYIIYYNNKNNAHQKDINEIKKLSNEYEKLYSLNQQNYSIDYYYFINMLGMDNTDKLIRGFKDTQKELQITKERLEKLSFQNKIIMLLLSIAILALAYFKK